MIKEFFGSIICKFKGHKKVFAGSCPFTGGTYDYCSVCNRMMPREELS
jgi:hypothetical protein